VHGEDRLAAEIAVEDDVLLEVRDRIRVGCRARCGVELRDIALKAKPGFLIEPLDLGKIDRVGS